MASSTRPPSGQLTNRLSNDLNVLDSALGYVLTEFLEKASMTLVMIASAMQLNVFIIIPGLIVLFIIFFIAFYFYDIIMASQALGMRIKSPLFTSLSEMVNGLIHFTIYNRRFASVRKFAKQVNNSLKARVNFIIVSNLSSTITIVTMYLFIFVALVLGIYTLSPDNYLLYGIQITFLFQASVGSYMVMRLFISIQSYMVNTERAFQMTSLTPEAPLDS